MDYLQEEISTFHAPSLQGPLTILGYHQLLVTGQTEISALTPGLCSSRIITIYVVSHSRLLYQHLCKISA